MTPERWSAMAVFAEAVALEPLAGEAFIGVMLEEMR
jgi:hypothetical protein